MRRGLKLGTQDSAKDGDGGLGSSNDGVPAGGGRDSIWLPWRCRAAKVEAVELREHIFECAGLEHTWTEITSMIADNMIAEVLDEIFE